MTHDAASHYSQWFKIDRQSPPDARLGAAGSTQTTSWSNWMTPLMVAAGRTTAQPVHPLQLSADLAFGAFADALGVRPLRELQQAGTALAKAQADQHSAQVDYIGLLFSAFADATRGLLDRLERMRRDGDQVTTLRGLFKLWTLQFDAALHERMQSPQGLETAASAVQASTRQRAELQLLVALLSRAVNIPTREEVDDGFREIQELKREVRHLKQALASIGPRPADDDAAPGTRPAEPTRKSSATKRTPAKRMAARLSTKGTVR